MEVLACYNFVLFILKLTFSVVVELTGVRSFQMSDQNLMTLKIALKCCGRNVIETFILPRYWP